VLFEFAFDQVTPADRASFGELAEDGGFFHASIILGYAQCVIEMIYATIGPYVCRLEKNEKGISRVDICMKPFHKKKNSNKFSIQNKKIVQLETFAKVPLDVRGTSFQLKVWNATAAIPYGETRTYAQIAKAIGHPKAVRAVGTALGKNPVCILVPCHRVVPSSGGIGNYAHGKAMKRWLLDHEARGA
jgi:O-6-methylguanine DNA methyltransferase